MLGWFAHNIMVQKFGSSHPRYVRTYIIHLSSLEPKWYLPSALNLHGLMSKKLALHLHVTFFLTPTKGPPLKSATLDL